MESDGELAIQQGFRHMCAGLLSTHVSGLDYLLNKRRQIGAI